MFRRLSDGWRLRTPPRTRPMMSTLDKNTVPSRRAIAREIGRTDKFVIQGDSIFPAANLTPSRFRHDFVTIPLEELRPLVKLMLLVQSWMVDLGSGSTSELVNLDAAADSICWVLLNSTSSQQCDLIALKTTHNPRREKAQQWTTLPSHFGKVRQSLCSRASAQIISLNHHQLPDMRIARAREDYCRV